MPSLLTTTSNLDPDPESGGQKPGPFEPLSVDRLDQPRASESGLPSEWRFGVEDALEELAVAVGDADFRGVAANSTSNEEAETKNAYIAPAGPDEAVLEHDRSGTRAKNPFHRWVRSLHKQSLRRQQEALDNQGVWPPLWEHEEFEDVDERPNHHRESSDSSMAYVTGVRSASVSVAASLSLLNHARQNAAPSLQDLRSGSGGQSSLQRSRRSEDSNSSDRQEQTLDSGVLERALQRRRIIDELITTEEAYIRDLRFLTNAYITILAAVQSSPPGLRPLVNQLLNDMVELHNEILQELNRALLEGNSSPPSGNGSGPQSANTGLGHRRCKSAQLGFDPRTVPSSLRNMPGMLAEPKTAANVAKVFLKRKHRFFIYEEYSAVFDKVKKDVEMADRVVPGWSANQKGLEVLGSSVFYPPERGGDRSRRALAIKDLVVKPVQRACKYHLLFKDLSRHTPVIDCPTSHMEIEKTVSKLLDIATEVNEATNSPRARAAADKSRIIHARLVFPDQTGEDWRLRNRWLGHIQLCGVLHVSWQVKDGAVGQYMAALLYREWLCLATAEGPEQLYTVQVCIALDNLKVEEVDNNRGLQCHSARHSWKIVFISNNQLYELMLTACSPKEELEWRSRLSKRSSASPSDDRDPAEMEGYTADSMNIKTLGTVYRKSGTHARNISISRATTIGPKPPLCQVILKNTSNTKERDTPPPSPAPISRSQSVPSPTTRVTVLAPPRAERARLEALLADIWSRDVLPFPGLSAPRSRSEQFVRASASSVMRKLGSVTITGGFRRSSSMASVGMDDGGGSVNNGEEMASWKGRGGGGGGQGITPSSTLPSLMGGLGSTGPSGGAGRRLVSESAFLKARTPPSSSESGAMPPISALLSMPSLAGEFGPSHSSRRGIPHSVSSASTRWRFSFRGEPSYPNNASTTTLQAAFDAEAEEWETGGGVPSSSSGILDGSLSSGMRRRRDGSALRASMLLEDPTLEEAVLEPSPLPPPPPPPPPAPERRSLSLSLSQRFRFMKEEHACERDEQKEAAARSSRSLKTSSSRGRGVSGGGGGGRKWWKGFGGGGGGGGGGKHDV